MTVGKLPEDDHLTEVDNKRIVQYIARTLYYFVASIECAIDLNVREWFSKVLFEYLIKSMSDVCETYPSLTSVIARSLSTPIDQAIGCDDQPGQVNMYHDHIDFDYRRRPLLDDCEACNCSILQLLFRHSLKLNPQYRNFMLESIVYFTADQAFKEYVTVNYYQYFCLYYSQKLTVETQELAKPHSKVIELCDQYLVVDSLSKLIVEQVNISDILAGILKICCCHLLDKVATGDSDLWNSYLFDTLKLLLWNPSANRVFFQNKEWVKSYLMHLVFFEDFSPQMIYTKLDSDIESRDLLDFQVKLNSEMQVVNYKKTMWPCTTSLSLSNPDSRECTMNMLCALAGLIKTLADKRKNKDEDKKRGVNTDCTVERIFVMYMVSYLLYDKQEYDYDNAALRYRWSISIKSSSMIST